MLENAFRGSWRERWERWSQIDGRGQDKTDTGADWDAAGSRARLVSGEPGDHEQL